MSGGVDSATVAALLVNAGYDVTAVYMKNWSSEFGIQNNCPWEQDVADVEQIAKHLGIPWRVYNFEKQYRERVLQYFFDEYKAGRTPNPDILCNNKIKFDLFLEKAVSEGADAIATGHYARRANPEKIYPWEYTADLGLYTAFDENKDQGYFLQRISRFQLEHATFPLGNLIKPEVRVLANHFHLPVATKKDSQGICFIGDIDVRDFLKRELHTKPGNIIDIDTGKKLADHQGLWFYTIGQRHGMGIGGVDNPYFVVAKDAIKNIVYVAQGHDSKHLVKQNVEIEDLHFITTQIENDSDVWVSLRYREAPKKAKLHMNGTKATLLFENSDAWAPAPGQSALLYSSDVQKISEKPLENAAEILKYVTGPEINRGRFSAILGGGIISDVSL